jgi:hypothetical protein
MKFFKRSDRPTVPVLSKAAAEERMVLDDPDVTLRAWEDQAGEYAEPESEERSDETPAETPEVPAEETRSDDTDSTVEERTNAFKAMDHANLCKQWVAGEPCVRPKGHDVPPGDAEDGHKPMCWGRKNGLPCNHPAGHEGDHEPVQVKSRSDETPAETPEAELSIDEARAMLDDKFGEELDLSIFDD